MQKDYCRVIEENEQLNDELRNRTEVIRANAELIATLESQLKKSVQTVESSNGQPNIDFQNEIDELQRQLAERDKTIEDLSYKMDNLEENESPNETNDNVDSDLLDASQKLKQNIADLEKVSEEVEGILNEKQNQLLEQQAIIDELKKQLESQQEPSKDNEEYLQKLKEMEDAISENGILANQAALQEEQNIVLLNEYNKLLTTTEKLMKSISVVKKELWKYNFY